MLCYAPGLACRLQRGPALTNYQHGVDILSGSDDVVETG